MLYCTAVNTDDPSAEQSLAALARTLREHEPDAELLVLSVGGSPLALPPGATPAPAGAGPPLWQLALTTDPTEVAGVLAGPALKAALALSESATFLSPAIRVHASLGPLANALEGHVVALVPLLEGPLPDDDLRPGSVEFSAWGRFSPSIIAMRRSPVSDTLLASWPEASNPLPEDTIGPTPKTVRHHLESAAGHQGVTVVTDRGIGAGFWNLPLRPPVELPDGSFAVGGEPLRALDLTGIDPYDPHSVWPQQNRFDLTACPEFGIMLLRYADELVGDQKPEAITDRGGHEIDAALRLLAAEALIAGELTASPWTDAGAAEWEAIVEGPSPVGAASGVTRYQHALWRIREDLREHFPDPATEDAEALVRWYYTWGPGAAEAEQERQELGEPIPLPETLPWGVNVAGYFRSALGLGEAARLVIAGLDSVHVPALPIHGSYVPPTRQNAEFTYTTPAEAPYPINLLCLNGDIVPLFAQEVGRPFFRGRHTIAMWWWEIDNVFPEDWRAAFDYLDEIWVATEHIRRAIEPHSPIPVNVVRMPVDVPEFPPLAREQLGMPEDGYTFLFIYDYHSSGGRKNPLGLIEAFKSAFAPGEGAKLVLKTINGHRVSRQHLAVLAAAGQHPDITVIDRFVSADEKNAMVAACDCYVSLHRSEGFGLTPAEAMLLGKPVIATRYGGVLDFMTDENAMLVDHGWSLVGPEAAPYPAQGRWAEPDLDQASSFMRRLFEDRALGKRLGERARADLQSTHSPEVAGATMAMRLKEIHDELMEEAVLPGAIGRFDPAPAYQRLTGGLPEPTGRLRALKRAYAKILGRLANPVLRQQRAVDHRLLDGVVELSRQVDAVGDETAGVLREERAQTLAAMRRLRASELAHDRRLQQLEDSLEKLTTNVKELQDVVVSDIQRRSGD